ncbi:MAG TPA: hypothetical protein VIH57_03615 [Bacteroidales bacterium]
MKRILLIIMCFATSFSINAQSTNDNKSDSLPSFYLGLGTGINSYTGLLGISGNLRVYHKLFIQGGLGVGSWGSKMTIGLRYDMSYQKGWSYGIGFSSCSGLTDFKTNMELTSGIKKEVTMDLLRAYTLNLKATRNWKLGKNNTFYLEFGYAIPLQSSPWRIKDGSELSSTSIAVMNTISPGGLLIGLGFTFGL